MHTVIITGESYKTIEPIGRVGYNRASCNGMVRKERGKKQIICFFNSVEFHGIKGSTVLYRCMGMILVDYPNIWC